MYVHICKYLQTCNICLSAWVTHKGDAERATDLLIIPAPVPANQLLSHKPGAKRVCGAVWHRQTQGKINFTPGRRPSVPRLRFWGLQRCAGLGWFTLVWCQGSCMVPCTPSPLLRGDRHKTLWVLIKSSKSASWINRVLLNFQTQASLENTPARMARISAHLCSPPPALVKLYICKGAAGRCAVHAARAPHRAWTATKALQKGQQTCL